MKFQPVTETNLRVLIYGRAKTGKTMLALGAPGTVAVFDTEDGCKFYAGSTPFVRILSQELDELHRAIDHLAARPDGIQTLVVDSVSVLYQNAVLAHMDAGMMVGYQKWAGIHKLFEGLYNHLITLPLNVVLVARETARYAPGDRRDIKAIGVKPEADEAIAYWPDITLRTEVREENGQRVYGAWFEHIRGASLPRPQWRTGVDWDMLVRAADYGRSGGKPAEAPQPAAGN